MPTDNNYCGWADGRTDGLVPLSMCRRGGGGARRGKLAASGFSSFSIVTRPRRGGGRGNQKRYWVLPRRSYQSSSSSSSSSARLTAAPSFPLNIVVLFVQSVFLSSPREKAPLGGRGEPANRRIACSAAPRHLERPTATSCPSASGQRARAGPTSATRRKPIVLLCLLC